MSAKALLSIGLGSALIYGGYRQISHSKSTSLMIAREPDTKLFDATTEQILEEMEGVLQDGDWILTRSYTLHGDVVDLFQPRGASSHVAVYDGQNGDIIEAMGEGVRILPLRRLVDESHSFIVIRPQGMSDERKRLAVLKARAEVGKKFDMLGVIGIYNSPSRWYCSELIFYAFDLPREKRIIRPTDLLDYGGVVYAAIRTNVALQERAKQRLG